MTSLLAKRDDTLSEHQKIALDYLEVAQRAYEKSGKDRAYWAGLAREYGLPWRTIGDSLNMTDAGARMLVKRHKQVM